MEWLKIIVPLIWFLFGNQLAYAQSLTTDQMIARLQAGGHVIYLLNASSEPHQKDLDKGDFSHCEKQRNLSEKGRNEASRIGEAILQLNIPIGPVLTSPYCRCVDTAELAFGKHEKNHNLQFSIKKDKAAAEMLGYQLKQMMMRADTSQGNAVFVGHSSNLREGLGVWPRPEGVAVLFEKQDGDLEFIGMIKPREWPLI